MTDRPDFDSDNRLTDRVTGMTRRQLIEMMEKLCGIVSAQAGEDGFRGGVRPGNISLGADGSVALGPGGRSERDKWTAEELEFMSPEEFWDGECTAASDVYSLGLLMYYCAAGGKMPFHPEDGELTAKKRAELMRRRMSGEKITAPKNAGKSLGAVIEKATAFEGAERYARAADIPVVLELCLRELDSVAKPDSDEIFDKSAEELTDVEKMMVGIISKAAEDAALSGDDGDKEADGPKPEDTKPQPPEKDAPVDEPTVVEKAVAETEKPQRTEPVDEPTVVMAAQKPAPPRNTARPAVQYNTNQPKPVHKKQKNSKKPVILALVLCAFVIIAAIAVKAMWGNIKPKPAATPTPTVEVTPTVTPTETPTPTPTETATATPTQTPETTATMSNGGATVPAVTSPVKPTTTKKPTATQKPVTTKKPVVTAKPTATPKPTVKPTATPAPSVTPVTDKYGLIQADVSWTEAQRLCEEKGGHLLVIDSQKKLDEVGAIAKSKGIRFVWLGCRRDGNGNFVWVNGQNVTFYKWTPGEPSGTDTNGSSEDYILLWNTKKDLSGDWEYNDVGNDPVSVYPAGYAGKIAYICEYD